MLLTTIFNHNGELLLAYMGVILTIAIISVLPQYNANSNRGLNLWGLAILTFLMSLMPIQSGDFVYYALIFKTKVNITHFEDFYIDLWTWNPDYIGWRAVVWGATVILLIATILLLRINNKFACFIFVITQFFYLGAYRNMFGFMMMFFSIAILFRGLEFTDVGKQFLSLVIGIVGLYLCTYLHKSMPMYVAFLILALIPFGMRLIKAALCAFPIVYSSIFFLSKWFVGWFLDEDMQNHSEAYTDSVREITFMQTIIDLVCQASYLLLFYIIQTTISKYKKRIPSVITFFTRYAFVLMYLGFLFYGQTTGGWLYSRFVTAGELSLMFVMMYILYFLPRTRPIKVAFGGLIFVLIYRMLYVFYGADKFIERINQIQL